MHVLTYLALIAWTFVFMIRHTLAVPPMPPQQVPNFPMRHNPPQASGIKDHQVYAAGSVDSLNWKKDDILLFDSASVPDAVITKEGTIFLYFVDAAEGHHLSVAVSKDFGKTWQKSRVLIENKQNPGDAVDPDAVLLPDGQTRLFYFGNFIEGAPLPPGKKHQIYSALSTDGIHFVEDKGVRIEAIGITDPDAVQIGNEWKIFVSQPMDNKNLSFSSKDGMNFTQDAEPVSTTGAISSTIKIGAGWRMYKCSRGGISSQFSIDLKAWVDEGLRLEGPVCDPSVIELPDGTFKMFYKTFKH